MNNKFVKIGLSVLIIAFLLFQIYSATFSSISTTSAIPFEYTEGIDTTGIIIRDETLVKNSEQGTLHFAVVDGEKIAKGGVIAHIYDGDSASANATKIEELKAQLKQIEEIEGYNNMLAVDLNTVNAKISNYYNDFAFNSALGKYDKLNDSVSGLLTMMTRKKVATGEQTDFSSLKDAINIQIDQLSQSSGNVKGSIKATVSGYFVSVVDNFEDKLSTKDLSVFTPDYFNELTEGESSEDVIGKIVYDYEWYIACLVPINDSKFYKIGETVTLKTTTTSNPRLTAKVERVNLSPTGDDAVIIFSCNEMSSELATMRSGAITIIKNEYSGLKVDSKALRVVDGKTGVYIVSGLEAKFVEANILYSNDSYAICELNNSDSSKLRLYDEVIVKGKNLYDGKIIY
ncbi:MAG: hypothetical protein IKK77_01290 [Clostridia bacterium]|nr:hypothetical protein [Clostridia bacterium]